MELDSKEKDFYLHYGIFCVRFEYVMANIRGILNDIFKHIGVKDHRYVLALLNNDTANQLSTKLILTARIFYYWPVSYDEKNGKKIAIPKEKKSIEVIQKLSAYIDELSSYRNLLVHGTWAPNLKTSGSENLIIGNYHRPRKGEGEVIRTHVVEIPILKEICTDLLKVTELQKNISDLIASKKNLEPILTTELYKELPKMKSRVKIKEVL